MRSQRTTELAPGVHAVRLMSCTGFLFVEERLTIIDAGLPGSRIPLQRYLRRIGRGMDELDRIICTHGHPDHVGGVRELAADGAEVLIHPDDLAGLSVTFREALRSRSRGPLLHYFTPHPGATTPLHDGDVLPILGGLHVIHTPGHTPGSICLWAPRDRILFTGDVLQVRRRKLTYASAVFSHDYAAARASLGRLAELDPRVIAMAHFPAWTTDCRATLQGLVDAAAG